MLLDDTRVALHRPERQNPPVFRVTTARTAMPENIEADFRKVHDTDVPTRFLSGSRIEVVGDFVPGQTPLHVLFDFDGTLSLIREGWPEVMVPMMIEYLQATGTSEDTTTLHNICAEFVMELTGKQTIYQMIRLADEVRQRGGTPPDPVDYKNEYHARLMHRIEARRERLRSGRAEPAEMMVPGSVGLLEQLRTRGTTMYLASGTDEHYVREEVALLQLDSFFGQHIYGARDDYKAFSKAQVIDRILSDNSLDGHALLGFGDGFVEIQNLRDAGGTAVAVASDESGRSGQPDAWKRQRLIAAGAHVVVPDYAEATRLIDWLWTGQE